MYVQRYDLTGRFIGVRRTADNADIAIGGRGWEDFLAWDVGQPAPLDRSDRAAPEPTPEEKLAVVPLPLALPQHMVAALHAILSGGKVPDDAAVAIAQAADAVASAKR